VLLVLACRGSELGTGKMLAYQNKKYEEIAF
jgi:hypothetical protein